MRLHRGFTLIELMVAVAILAILSGIAYPLYDSQSRKGKRPDGITALEKIAQAEQRYFSDNGTFTITVTTLPGITSATSPGGYYTLSVAAGAGGIGSSFVVTATPVGNQLQDTCRSFTLSNTGARGVTAVYSNGDAVSATDARAICWGK